MGYEIVDYRIVSSDYQGEMEYLVNELIKENYQPYKGIIIRKDGSLYQVMVKYNKGDK